MDSSRRLVAIMFADIVGYAAMMGKDGTEAMSVVTHFEKTITEETKKVGGEIINFYGDGSLTIFESITIAYELNFGDPTNMFNYFKKHVGMSPIKFKKLNEPN
jgi:AraC-like DNA-binding protein